MAHRAERQLGIIDPNILLQLHVMIVGVGAIGRQVAIQLASMGVGKLTLIDPDVVSVENMATQGFLEDQIGDEKPLAVKELCSCIFAGCDVQTRNEKYVHEHGSADIIMCCVDNMEGRKFIHETTESRCRLFIDGRMSARSIQIYTDMLVNPDGWPDYRQTLFNDHEAYRENCTEKATIYTASIAAGLMVNQMVNFLTMPLEILPPVIMMNLLSLDLERPKELVLAQQSKPFSSPEILIVP